MRWSSASRFAAVRTIEGASAGTLVQLDHGFEIRLKNDTKRYEPVLPPERVATAFTELIQPCVDELIAGIHESRTLVALCDALLPTLMSGELRIENPVRFMSSSGRYASEVLP